MVAIAIGGGATISEEDAVLMIAAVENIDHERSKSSRVLERIRTIVQRHARLAVSVDFLNEDCDLYDAGMTSHASVNVMLALENEFDLEFPDRMLKRSVFESMGAIGAAIRELQDNE